VPCTTALHCDAPKTVTVAGAQVAATDVIVGCADDVVWFDEPPPHPTAVAIAPAATTSSTRIPAPIMPTSP
jgi:hypothetical protein